MPILNVENIASTVEITTNGVHDVTQYTSADVNVSPVISSLNVTPTTSAQQITAPQGTDGYSPVNVSAVTSSIDANIQAGNIKDGVTILGVTGNYQGGGGGGASAPYIQFTIDNGTLSTPVTLNLTGFTDVGDNILRKALMNVGTWGITSLDLSNLTAITGESACDSMCLEVMGLTTCDLSNVQTIGNSSCMNMFSYSSLSSIDLGSLQTIGQMGCMNMFAGCIELTSLDLSNLQTIANSGCMDMCDDCEQLATVDFSSLSYIAAGGLNSTFSRCSALTELSFPALTTNSFEDIYVFQNMLEECEDITLHFPSNIQSEVEALDGYPDFGGTNTTVLFDLAATE